MMIRKIIKYSKQVSKTHLSVAQISNAKFAEDTFSTCEIPNSNNMLGHQEDKELIGSSNKLIVEKAQPKHAIEIRKLLEV